MFYQFVQTIAFSRTTIAVEQLMTKTLSNVGHSYIVDCQAQGKEGIYPFCRVMKDCRWKLKWMIMKSLLVEVE